MMRTSQVVFLVVLASTLFFPFVYGLPFDGDVDYSADGSGKINFVRDFTASGTSWSSGLIVFGTFQDSGESWANLGFDVDNGAIFLVSDVSTSEIAGTLTGTEGTVTTIRFYATGRGVPADVSGVRDYTHSTETDIITATVDIYPASIVVSWTAEVVDPGGSGSPGGSGFGTSQDDPYFAGVEVLDIVTPSWIQQNGYIIVIVGVALIFGGYFTRSTPGKRKQEAKDRLKGLTVTITGGTLAKRLKKATEKFKKRLEGDRW